jgi:hypothetical protein
MKIQPLAHIYRFSKGLSLSLFDGQKVTPHTGGQAKSPESRHFLSAGSFIIDLREEDSGILPCLEYQKMIPPKTWPKS